jgi:putative Ca2+/H+ antiporter (TMEM165/GDT1 family)
MELRLPLFFTLVSVLAVASHSGSAPAEYAPSSTLIIVETLSPAEVDATKHTLQPESTPVGLSDKASDATPTSGPTTRFGSSVATSFSLIVVSEFGDRTFFVTAILSLKYGKSLVLTGTTIAMCLHTILSTILGRILHMMPIGSSKYSRVPFDDYAAAILLLIFGVTHIFWAWTGRSETSSHDQSEAKEEVERLHYTRLGTRPSHMLIIKETFWLIFVAEFGDKSMITTVALAASQNTFGVLVGASIGNFVVSCVAVLAGWALRDYISERLANLIGGTLFLVFSFFTLAEALRSQGFYMWSWVMKRADTTLLALVASGSRPFLTMSGLNRSN